MKSLGLTRLERVALEEYVEALVETLPGEIKAVVLFGSKARGVRRPGRDTDVAIILRGEKRPSLRYAVADAAFGPIVRYRVDISPVLISSSSFREKSPLNQRIKEEGIPLWNGKRNLLASA